MITDDALFNGTLRIRQPARGYRFSIDAVILAHFAATAASRQVVELGAGCGVVSLILARLCPQAQIRGIEIQAELAALAQQNCDDNKMADRVRIDCGDIKQLRPGKHLAPVDWVVCNPPYYAHGGGRINAGSQKAISRHEICATLRDFLQAGYRMLNISGRLTMIYPAARTVDLMVCLRSVGLEPKIVQPVCAQAGQDARLILVQAVKGGRAQLKWVFPLVIYDDRKRYTRPLRDMLQGWAV